MSATLVYSETHESHVKLVPMPQNTNAEEPEIADNERSNPHIYSEQTEKEEDEKINTFQRLDLELMKNKTE